MAAGNVTFSCLPSNGEIDLGRVLCAKPIISSLNVLRKQYVFSEISVSLLEIHC